ncbi:MAG: adenosylcobinamide-GDP ribazoletransferase [Clostridia bacterium]|nr:adenosylcobinamide-GDP ribazoletransferase [Clostridia bacterium]
MRSFLLMLSFFTTLPFPQTEFSEERYKKGVNMLPFVGLVTGAILYGVSFADKILPEAALGIVLYLAYILITGGLHLDGLADSCDALFSGRDQIRMLEIMKDSRIGSFGVLGLIVASASYMVLLPLIPREALFILPVIGKCAPAIAANVAPYVREEGMGKMFTENCTLTSAVLAIAFANILGYILEPSFILGVDLAFLSVFILSQKVKSLLGGITGDILGFLCEASQIIFLFAMTLIYFAF